MEELYLNLAQIESLVPTGFQTRRQSNNDLILGDEEERMVSIKLKKLSTTLILRVVKVVRSALDMTTKRMSTK